MKLKHWVMHTKGEKMDNQVEMPDKKQTVSLMLKELEKIIHQAIDDGRAEPYTPLDLIFMAVQEVAAMAMQIQQVADDFENDDDTSGAGGTVQ